MGVSFATWVQLALTAAIAFAGVMQWLVSNRLKDIEANRSKTRLALRFAREPGHPRRLNVRVANLSSFGVMVEQVNFLVVAACADAPDIFRKQVAVKSRSVLAAFTLDTYDIHSDILSAIDHRAARFHCDVEASAIYLDNGVARCTQIERIAVTIEQQGLVEFPEG